MRSAAHRIAVSLLFVVVAIAPWHVVAAAAGSPGAIPARGSEVDDGDRSGDASASADRQLSEVLRRFGFTGNVESTLEQRLGRRVSRRLADLGRMLWFDTLTGLNDDNTCAGCHSPTHGFGDTQSIAIGIENNGVVGMHRTGPRNQRRSPIVINAAFYPNLMWNSRFASLSNDPFDNGSGFAFPPPEGLTLSHTAHLLAAQAFIPTTERNEAAGFVFPGDNFDIRAEVVRRLNATPNYRALFARSFPAVQAGGPITFDMVAGAIAEFEFTLVFTDAPLDRFARGEDHAMSPGEKKGALLFFGKASCVGCHAVSGSSNEMFSDFKPHVIGVPQVHPVVTNSVFDGPGADEDFGLEQVSHDPADRYKFRTTPLRNLAVMPAFMHDGCFTTIEEAVRHHLDVFESARGYRPTGLAPDLQGALGPIEPVLERVDPLLAHRTRLSNAEFGQLVGFLRYGLLDPRALPENLRDLVPNRVPSGRATLTFEFPDSRLAMSSSLGAGAPVGAAAAGQPSPTPMVAFRVHPPSVSPARGPVSFAIDMPRAGPVSAYVHDVAGRRVRALAEGSVLAAGSSRLVWEGTDAAGAQAAAGIYFLRVRSESGEGWQRVVWLGR